MNKDSKIRFVVDGHKYILTHGVKEISKRTRNKL